MEEVPGQVDHNTDGPGASERLIAEAEVRCAGLCKFTIGFKEGWFNGLFSTFR